jgi:hypothetical protein
MQQQRLQQEWAIHEDEQAHEMEIAEKKMANERYVAEVRAAVATGTQDINTNQQNDYLDTLKVLQNQQQNQSKLDFERDKYISQVGLENQKLDVQRQKIAAQDRRTTQELKTSRVFQEKKKKEQKK